MIKQRRRHACAIRKTMTYVIGGEAGPFKNSMEIWDGIRWTYSQIQVRNGWSDMVGSLLLQNTKLYFFTSWDNNEDCENLKCGEIWQIDERNRFQLHGNMEKSRSGFTIFTIPHNFLTTCKGLYPELN